MNIKTEPKPKCPECYAEMVLRYRKSDNKPFWGCNDFPECRGTRNIKADGTPEEDDDIFYDDDYDMDWHPGHPSNFGDR